MVAKIRSYSPLGGHGAVALFLIFALGNITYSCSEAIPVADLSILTLMFFCLYSFFISVSRSVLRIVFRHLNLRNCKIISQVSLGEIKDKCSSMNFVLLLIVLGVKCDCHR